jgi:hypothetical protein
MADKTSGELSDTEHVVAMRGHAVDDTRYAEMRGELDRRQIVGQINASAAQVDQRGIALLQLSPCSSR